MRPEPYMSLAWRTFSVLTVSFLLTGWMRPSLPSSAKLATERGERLDYFVVAVNGEMRIVKSQQTVPIVVGDTIEVQSAVLHRAGGVPTSVNFVGYRNPEGKVAEDRGFKIDSARDLLRGWSEGRQGRLYALIATSGPRLHGYAYFEMIDPQLRYAELTVNGVQRILRDGETVRLRIDDSIRVKKAVTNLQTTKGVEFQIAEEDGMKAVRFVRKGLVFAKIPLVIEN